MYDQFLSVALSWNCVLLESSGLGLDYFLLKYILISHTVH